MAKAVTLKDKDGNELYPVTSFDLVCGKSFFYKSTPQISPINIPTAWANTPVSSWAMTFQADVGAVYKFEVYTSFMSWAGSTPTELDLRANLTGATSLASASGVAVGTYLNGTAFPRSASGIIQATSSSATITPTITCGATGNYARLDEGYIFVMKIG